MAAPKSKISDREQRTALIAGIAAFVFWGLIPIYWKFFRAMPAAQILAHRFIWTTAFLILWLSWSRRWPEVLAAVCSRRTLIYCLTSGLAISINWLTFIWAVNVNRIIETSLGYFMTPLVNVLFGAIFLRERLTKWQLGSVLLAALAVANLSFMYGKIPWIALTLCLSWGTYGLLRKQSGTRPIPGLFLETTSIVPIAIIFLLFTKTRQIEPPQTLWLLASTGVVTGIPLVWFGYAARHLRLTTVGFLQFLSPIGSFFVGVFLYHEPFTRAHFITFGLIWIALAIFTAEAVTRWRSNRTQAAIAGPLADSAA